MLGGQPANRRTILVSATKLLPYPQRNLFRDALVWFELGYFNLPTFVTFVNLPLGDDLDTCPLLMIAVKPSTITPGSMTGAKYVWVGGKDVEMPHFDYVDYETKEVRASYTIGRDGLIQLAGV